LLTTSPVSNERQMPKDVQNFSNVTHFVIGPIRQGKDQMIAELKTPSTLFDRGITHFRVNFACMQGELAFVH
jgi:hypothetical protein